MIFLCFFHLVVPNQRIQILCTNIQLFGELSLNIWMRFVRISLRNGNFLCQVDIARYSDNGITIGLIKTAFLDILCLS